MVLTCGHEEPDCETEPACPVCKHFCGAGEAARDLLRGKPAAATARGPCRYLDDSTPLDRKGCQCPAKWVYHCEIYGGCTTTDQGADPHQACTRCPHYQAVGDEPDKPTPERLILTNHQAPGDGLVMSAAVESLHRAYPGTYITDVECSANACYENNPLVRRLEGEARASARRIRMEYPAVNRSDDRAIHFMEAFCEHLAAELGSSISPSRASRRPVARSLRVERRGWLDSERSSYRPRSIPLEVAGPVIHLSNDEKSWQNQVESTFGWDGPYWVLNAGHKDDFTAKHWGTANFQALVDWFQGSGVRGQGSAKPIVFVQIGEANHTHPPLRGVFDLRGQTDQRQLLRLCHHAVGGVGPTTFVQHIFAALRKPYVCILGGREPVTWVQYPAQTTLHTIGGLDCCRDRACWKSRTVKLGDGQASDQSLCRRPLPLAEPIPACMGMISVDEVASAVLRING